MTTPIRHLICLAAVLLSLNAAAARAEDIVVVVPAESSVVRLTRSQVTNLFLGRFKQLPGAGRAQPADVAPLKDDFYLRLVHKTPSEIGAYWARLVYSGQTMPPAQVASVDDVLVWADQTQGAITYLPASRVDDRVRVVFELGE